MQNPVYIATAKDQGMAAIPKTPSPRLRQYKKTDTAPNKQNLITSGSTPLQADYDATSAARPLQTHVTYWASTRTMMVSVIPASLTTRRQQTLLHYTDAVLMTTIGHQSKSPQRSLQEEEESEGDDDSYARSRSSGCISPMNAIRCSRLHRPYARSSSNSGSRPSWSRCNTCPRHVNASPRTS